MLKEKQKLNIYLAISPLLLLIAILGLNVYLFDNPLNGPNQIALIMAASIAAFVSILNKIKIDHLIQGISANISSTSVPIIILILVGALTSSWIISGIVPTMIYYGLKILSPTIFLPSCVVIAALASIITGSSWSTIATIGIALLSIGKAMHIPDAISAGAIISGAYFGDKLSILSDTTNLAASITGTKIFTHIRYMLITTIPSIVISIILFMLIGLFYISPLDPENVRAISSIIESKFNINLLLLTPPLIIIILIYKKVNSLVVIFLSCIIGMICAFIFQKDLILSIYSAQEIDLSILYNCFIKTLGTGFSIHTDNEAINNLFSSGGAKGMLNTIWLIICAMIFGGIMEKNGALQIISKKIIGLSKGVFSLFATTTGTCLFFNLTTSDQSISIVVPGKMYANTFKEKGLAPQNLSRTLEDSATVTSVLIPWNGCGATQSAVLGVATLSYLPFAFFNILSPIMTLIVALIRFKIKKLPK